MTQVSVRSLGVRTVLLVAVCLPLLGPVSVRAGQIPSHIYTAQRSITYLSGPARTLVDGNLDAYFSGSMGPDIIGVVMTTLDTPSAFPSVGAETHYSDRKARLALNLLDCATTDRERAYALGWITHYVNDTFVHQVVNDYGGYYEEFGYHHKELEQLECKHVFSVHGDIATQSWSQRIPVNFGPTFAEFIFDAYHKTFPDNELYQSGNEWYFENRPYFCERYNEASDWCLEAGKKFHASHASGTGDHGYAAATWKFPDMPSTNAYELLATAIEVTEVEAGPEKLRVTVNVNDSKLYGRFLVDWEANTKAAILYARRVFRLASAYLSETDAVRRGGLRVRFLGVIPNHNLDRPRADFTTASAKPGNVDIENVTYELTLHPAPPGTPVVLRGQSPAISFTATNFAGSRSGQVSFDIPFRAGLTRGRYSLRLALSGKDAFENPEYRNVDWTQVEGDLLSTPTEPTDPGLSGLWTDVESRGRPTPREKFFVYQSGAFVYICPRYGYWGNGGWLDGDTISFRHLTLRLETERTERGRELALEDGSFRFDVETAGGAPHFVEYRRESADCTPTSASAWMILRRIMAHVRDCMDEVKKCAEPSLSQGYVSKGLDPEQRDAAIELAREAIGFLTIAREVLKAPSLAGDAEAAPFRAALERGLPKVVLEVDGLQALADRATDEDGAKRFAIALGGFTGGVKFPAGVADPGDSATTVLIEELSRPLQERWERERQR